MLNHKSIHLMQLQFLNIIRHKYYQLMIIKLKKNKKILIRRLFKIENFIILDLLYDINI